MVLISCKSADDSNLAISQQPVPGYTEHSGTGMPDVIQEDGEMEDNMGIAEQEVLEAYQMRCNAMVEIDIETLDYLMDEALILHHITGATQTKKAWLDCIETEEMRYYGIESRDVMVEVVGDTATIWHTAVIQARIYGSRGTWTLSGKSYYEKRDGVWIWANFPE